MSPWKAEFSLAGRRGSQKDLKQKKMQHAAVGLKMESLSQEELKWPLGAESASQWETSALSCKDPNSAHTRNEHERRPEVPENPVASTGISVWGGTPLWVNFSPEELYANKWELHSLAIHFTATENEYRWFLKGRINSYLHLKPGSFSKYVLPTWAMGQVHSRLWRLSR